MAVQAGRLIHWALRPLARPAQEAEYQQLVGRYHDNNAFRDLVRGVADGLGLLVVDVSDHGVVLVPQQDSIFALKPADFRPGASKVDDRLMDGLAQVAIAATVFPRARDLDEDSDIVRPPVTVDEVDALLRRLCERLSEQARAEPDPDASDENRGLTEAWRLYLQRLEVLETKDARKAVRSTRRVLENSLDRLREFGCFTQVQQGQDAAWQPTRRYQVMVKEFSASALFQLVQEALQQDAPGGSS